MLKFSYVAETDYFTVDQSHQTFPLYIIVTATVSMLKGNL